MKFFFSALVIVLAVIASSESFRIKRQNDLIFFPDEFGPGPVPGPPAPPRPRPNANGMANGGPSNGNGAPMNGNGMPANGNGMPTNGNGMPTNGNGAPNNGSRRPNSPEFLRCMKQCPTTTEYNPVCGSDQVQYHNEQRLNCANNCGARVQFVRRGNCLGVLATNTIRF